MDFVMPNFALAIPEMFVLGMACLILIVDLFLRENDRIVTYLLTQATLVGAAILTITSYSDQTALTFSDTFVRDRMGDVLKVFIYLVSAVVFLYSRDYLRSWQLYKGEYFVVGLFGVLGMMVLVSAHSLLTVYLGLELLSLSLYTMVAMRRDSLEASEAAMKYFVLGALASGLLLYGMSMLYGVTGTLDIAGISAAVAHNAQAGQGTNVVLVFALVFIIIGVMFKLGGKANRFKAIVSVDKRSKAGGSARFRVYSGDFFSNKVLWDSGKLTADSASKEIDIDVKNVDCLMLVFEGEQMFGNWGEARVERD